MDRITCPTVSNCLPKVLEGRRSHTGHEVWAVYDVSSCLGIMVTEHPVIGEIPPKGIRDKQNQSLWLDAFVWLCNVRRHTVDGRFSTFRVLVGDAPAKTIRTRHGDFVCRLHLNQEF
jgi:hypothetical protein